jgi:oxygen-dependent protoporphyrinogen oxidase
VDVGTKKVAVIGSGISGLTAALRLHNAGVEVEVLERDFKLGGRFGIDTLGDKSVMLGGKNIGRKYSSLRAFLGWLGVANYEEFGINSSRVINGQIHTLDSSRRLRSLKNIFQMGTLGDLLRVARIARQVRKDESARFLGSELSSDLYLRYGDEVLSGFFGRKITSNMLRPMTVRMNGAEPSEFYLSNFGTNLAMVMDTYDQLKRGIQPALNEISRIIPVKAGTRVIDLSMTRKRCQGVLVHDESRNELTELDYDGVILAMPADAAAEILAKSMSRLSGCLRQVKYHPSTVGVIEYDGDVFTHEVRAIAMDDGPCSNAGAYGINDRNIVRYTFSGKPGRLHNPGEQYVRELIRATERKLENYLGINIPPQVRGVFRHWKTAYCAYAPAYPRLLGSIRGQVESVRGLELAGDYLKGVSLESCCRSGGEAAATILAN